jgi:hypothetical protein
MYAHESQFLELTPARILTLFIKLARLGLTLPPRVEVGPFVKKHWPRRGYIVSLG